MKSPPPKRGAFYFTSIPKGVFSNYCLRSIIDARTLTA